MLAICSQALFLLNTACLFGTSFPMHVILTIVSFSNHSKLQRCWKNNFDQCLHSWLQSFLQLHDCHCIQNHCPVPESSPPTCCTDYKKWSRHTVGITHQKAIMWREGGWGEIAYRNCLVLPTPRAERLERKDFKRVNRTIIGNTVSVAFLWGPQNYTLNLHYLMKPSIGFTRSWHSGILFQGLK